MKLAVIAFPGNNCETETRRAAIRNGFDAEILRWNQIDKIGHYDAYVLPGGFSFEDRGRSGVLASREKIFDALRREAQTGKIILGICNGAQMVVESGLIPVGNNPLPFALAKNVRRDEDGHVLGTGFYNDWIYVKAARTDTAFTNQVKKELRLPIAHGEGRFETIDQNARQQLENGDSVAFRYCDQNGEVSEKFPVTPNGAQFATAGIVNKEGTIMAFMPHPERFFDNFDGDQIFQSMKSWIEEKKSPKSVEIGNFNQMSKPEIKSYQPKPGALLLEKKLIITDNEQFSVRSACESMMNEKITLEKTVLFEINGGNLDEAKIIKSGLILNQSKEFLVQKGSENKYGIQEHEDDYADHLAEKLSEQFGQKVSVKILKCWDFENTAQETIDAILQNRILANPNSAKMVKL